MKCTRRVQWSAEQWTRPSRARRIRRGARWVSARRWMRRLKLSTKVKAKKQRVSEFFCHLFPSLPLCECALSGGELSSQPRSPPVSNRAGAALAAASPPAHGSPMSACRSPLIDSTCHAVKCTTMRRGSRHARLWSDRLAKPSQARGRGQVSCSGESVRQPRLSSVCSCLLPCRCPMQMRPFLPPSLLSLFLSPVCVEWMRARCDSSAARTRSANGSKSAVRPLLRCAATRSIRHAVTCDQLAEWEEEENWRQAVHAWKSTTRPDGRG